MRPRSGAGEAFTVLIRVSSLLVHVVTLVSLHIVSKPQSEDDTIAYRMSYSEATYRRRCGCCLGLAFISHEARHRADNELT